MVDFTGGFQWRIFGGGFGRRIRRPRAEESGDSEEQGIGAAAPNGERLVPPRGGPPPPTMYIVHLGP